VQDSGEPAQDMTAAIIFYPGMSHGEAISTEPGAGESEAPLPSGLPNPMAAYALAKESIFTPKSKTLKRIGSKV